MSYDLVRSVRNLIQQGVGDASRLGYILNRLENGKYLYLSDQKYLEDLLSESDIITSQPPETKVDSHSLGKLESDLKQLNTQLEKILKKRDAVEKMPSDSDLRKVETPAKERTVHVNTPVHYKSEHFTLILTVVLGLISLQGIGHIYLGKTARGVGILALSLLLFTLWLSYVMGVVSRDSVPSFVSVYFLPVTAAGYLGLYIFQILDSKKLCSIYNEYVSEQGKKPPWW